MMDPDGPLFAGRAAVQLPGKQVLQVSGQGVGGKLGGHAVKFVHGLTPSASASC